MPNISLHSATTLHTTIPFAMDFSLKSVPMRRREKDAQFARAFVLHV